MKKYKGIPKNLIAQDNEDQDSVKKIELPEHQPLDEEEILDLSEVSVDEEVSVVDELPIELTETQEFVGPKITELEADQKSKTPFWKSLIKEPEGEVVSQKNQNQKVARKEEDYVMSYGANRPGGAMEPAAVISSTMVIKGDVELNTSLSVSGKVYGNITCKDQVDANEGSYFEGNINASAAKFMGGQVKGNVTCDNQFEMDQNSSMTGDLVAQSAVISGTVIGQIKCSDSVTLTRTASVTGDLYSASISVEAGAHLEGKYVVSSSATPKASVAATNDSDEE